MTLANCCPSLGSSRVRPGARVPLGSPGRCQVVTRSPPGHTPSSARVAQATRWLLRAASTLGFSFSLIVSKVPSFVSPPGRLCTPQRAFRGAQRRLPSGGHSPRASWARGAPRPGRGQRPVRTPAHWLSARAALWPSPLPGPDSMERSVRWPRLCVAPSLLEGRGFSRPLNAHTVARDLTNPEAALTGGPVGLRPLSGLRVCISSWSSATRFQKHL